MADLTITITNQLSLLGGGPPSLWATMRWGSDLWGNSDDNIEAVEKLVTGALGTSSSIATATDFVTDASTNTLTLSSAIATATDFVAATIANSVALASDIAVDVLSIGIWDYVFPGNVTNASERISTTYNVPTDPSSSWSEPSHPSTVWS